MPNRKMHSRGKQHLYGRMLDSEVVAIHEAMSTLWPNDTDLLAQCDALWLAERGVADVTDEHQNAAWGCFIRTINHRHVVHRRAVVLVALLSVLMAATVALAAGVLPWKLTWTNDQLRLEFIGATQVTDTATPGKSDNPLTYALREYQLEIPLPTYIPEGYVLQDVTINAVHENWIIARALYACGENQLSIRVTTGELDGSFIQEAEKDATRMEIIRCGEIDYYLYDNLDRNCVWWAHPRGYAATINSVLSSDELKKMIDSIGGSTDEEAH